MTRSCLSVREVAFFVLGLFFRVDQLITGQTLFLLLFWLTPDSLLALMQERSAVIGSGAVAE